MRWILFGISMKITVKLLCAVRQINTLHGYHVIMEHCIVCWSSSCGSFYTVTRSKAVIYNIDRKLCVFICCPNFHEWWIYSQILKWRKTSDQVTNRFMISTTKDKQLERSRLSQDYVPIGTQSMSVMQKKASMFFWVSNDSKGTLICWSMYWRDERWRLALKEYKVCESIICLHASARCLLEDL